MNHFLLISTLAFLLVMSFPAHTQRIEINSFEGLKTALVVGKTTKVVIYFAHCTRPETGKKSTDYPAIISGFEVGAFEFFPKNSLRNNKEFISIVAGGMDAAVVSKGYVYRFLKLYIYEDHKVVIHKSQINPLTFENEVLEVFEANLDYDESGSPGVLFYTDPQ